MAARCYKRLLQLIEKWPVDETKTGRDLGQYLRTVINKAHEENKFDNNLQYWDSEYLAIQRLINNEYHTKYPRSFQSSATGLNSEQCKIALSNEFLEELEEEDRSFVNKIFSKKN